jgi:ribonuclease E
MKDNTAAVHVQVPVEVTSFLLNEKRTEITKIELKQRCTVLLVPNKHLETPNYKLERLRHDDPRLENLSASYTMIEEPDEEVGITRREKNAKPKQEPVIKGVLPDQPAPVAQPKPEPAVAPGETGAMADDDREDKRRRRRRGGRGTRDERSDTTPADATADSASASPAADEGTETYADTSSADGGPQPAPSEDSGEGRRRGRGRDRYRRERRDSDAPATTEGTPDGEAAGSQFAQPQGVRLAADDTPASRDAARRPEPVAVVPIGLPRAEPFELPVDALQQVLQSSGLIWVHSDLQKVEAARLAMAAEPQPVRLPREPRPAAVADEGPLVLVETRRDLSQLKLPFDAGAPAH